MWLGAQQRWRFPGPGISDTVEPVQGNESVRQASSKLTNAPSAVAEEGKRLVQEWNQGLGEGFDKGRELSERTLDQPSSPCRELNRANLDLRWQAVRPGAKNQRTGSGVWETRQTKAGSGPGLRSKIQESKAAAVVDLLVQNLSVQSRIYKLTNSLMNGSGVPLIHLPSQTEWPHVGPDFFNVSQAFGLRTGLACIRPT